LRVKYNHAKHGAFMAAKRVGHPPGQDAAGATIMNSQGMVAAAMQGGFAGFQQAMWDGNTRWASLPDSPYGQPTMTMQGAYQTYQNALATLPDCQ
jgi:hypothetical protein